VKKSYTYRGVTKNTPFTADEKRKVSMRLRGLALALGNGARVNETIAPVETTKPKLTVVYEKETPRRSATKATKPKLDVVTDDDDVDAIITKVYGEPAKATKATTKKAKPTKWDEVKAGWEATREAGTYTCSCGKVFAALGTPEKGGALFHKAWTKAKGIYGKAEDHYIPTIK